jgi:hypothetical protein
VRGRRENEGAEVRARYSKLRQHDGRGLILCADSDSDSDVA